MGGIELLATKFGKRDDKFFNKNQAIVIENVLLTSFAWLSKPIALTRREIIVIRRRKGGKSIL